MSEYEYAELKEYITNGDIDIDVLAESGLLSKRLIRRFRSVKRYKDVDNIKETEEWERLGKSHINRKLRDAVANDRTQEVAVSLGLTTQENTNIADWKKYEKIKDLFRNKPIYSDFTNSVFAGYVFSSAVTKTGRGKTDWAYSLSEMAKSVNPDISFFSNQKSDEFNDLPKNWNNIKKIIREKDGEKFIIIDDASAFLQYADRQEGVMLSEELVYLRKNKTHLVLVSHTGRDVPANVRRHMFAIDKQDKKRAIIGNETTTRKSGAVEIANELLEVENIPSTSIKYEHREDAGYQISFDEEEQEEEQEQSESVEYPASVDSKTERIKYLHEVQDYSQKNIYTTYIYFDFLTRHFI
jgi:hypothetical protein